MPQASVFQPNTHDNFSENPDLAIIGAGRSAAALVKQLEKDHPSLSIVCFDSKGEGVSTSLNCEQHHDNIIALTERDGGWLLKGISGETYAAQRCVLATGFYQPKPPHLHLMDYLNTGRYVNDPRNIDYDLIDREENVLILGSGLYMMNIVAELSSRKHLGEIITLSRHGLIPQPKGSDTPTNPFTDQKPSNHIPTLLSQLRLAAESASWPAIIDGLLPIAPEIWQKMILSEKTQFIRHLRRYWHIVRHRVDDKLHDMIFHMKASGQLRVLSGYFRSIEKIDDESLAVQFRKRGTDDVQVIMTHKILNASGPNYNVTVNDDLLIQNALNQGYIHPHLCGFGIQLGPNSEALSNAPRVSKKLFAIGPLCKGEFYECVSERALEEQSFKISNSLVKS